ncbi:MAG: NAD(P)/FAD-dependent oxidoreductase [Gemmatimonadaceae bacterium]
MTRRDVIVVGGGPAGAATATALARAGVDVLVLDRARFPRAKACSEYLSPEASRMLAAMGALDDVERAGAAQLAGMRVRAPDGTWMRGEFAAAHGYRGYRDRGLALPRERLDSILLDCARRAGAGVEEGARVTDLERDVLGRVVGIRARTRGGPATLRARLIIGADGLRSVVARRLGLARVGRWPRRIALVAHYRGVADVGDCGEMHVERDGYAGLADVGGGLTNVAVVVPARRGREIAAAGAEHFFEKWLARRAHLAPRLAAAERTSPVLATGPFASHARRAWAPGAALVGDAAEFFDPFTGEGIYAALRGGELLASHLLSLAGARSLADDRADACAEVDRALRAYDRARRREFRGKWVVERIIGGAVASAFVMNRAARALAARRDLADLLVGVTGDFVPAREVLRPAFVLRLLVAAALGPSWPAAPTAR